MKKNILLIIASIIFSCNMDNKTIKGIEQFKKINELKAENIAIQGILGTPLQILKEDTFFLINEFRYDYLLYFYNVTHGKNINKAAQVGKGPNEFVPPVYISFNKKRELLIYESSKFCLKKYFVKNDCSLKLNFSLQLNGRSQCAYEINENYYLSTGFFDRYRFAIYDSTAKEIKRFGNFPKIDIFNKNGKKINLKNDTKAMLFQSNIDFTEDGLNFVVANSQLGLLELYSKYDSIYKKRKEFSLIDKVILKKYSSGRIISADIDDEYPKGFIDVHIKNKKIYTLYSGVTKKNPYNNSILMVFDINLSPIQAYILNRTVKAFDIDIKNKKIYAISEDKGEPEMIYFNF